jgi:hypothetical protein
MHTGKNSIAPESSLPQLGQVRLSSVFMGLTALQPQSEPKAAPHSTEWCEIVQRHPLANDGPASIASLCIQPCHLGEWSMRSFVSDIRTSGAKGPRPA